MAELTDDEAIVMAALLGLIPFNYQYTDGTSEWFHETISLVEKSTETGRFDSFCKAKNGNYGHRTLAGLSRLWLEFKEQEMAAHSRAQT